MIGKGLDMYRFLFLAVGGSGGDVILFIKRNKCIFDLQTHVLR